jgi:hypothetical protein
VRTVSVSLESLAPYSQSRQHDADPIKGERPDDREQRTWRQKCHTNDNGNILIPTISIRNSIMEASKVFPEKKGKGAQTYTKHFEGGIMVDPDPIVLPEKSETVKGERLSMTVDGKPVLFSKGGRVWRWFPVIPKWKGTATFHLIDDEITEKIFEHYANLAGMAIGIGRWRPRNRGMYGRFKVIKFEWK